MDLQNSAEATVKQVASINSDMSIFNLISSADLVGKLVLLILFVTSIWSWAIIFQKYMKYKTVLMRMNKFENLFWSGQMLDELYEKIKRVSDSHPLANVFIAAMSEWKRNEGKKYDKNFADGLKERIIRTMDLIKGKEMEKLETKISFLATVGSAAPFIGLFGTVWGIMHSFQSIAASKNTTLAVVAPGIAEALLATAVGLFAAIPAVVFYNFLTSYLNTINNKIDDFIIELYTLLSRAIDEEIN